MEPGFDRLEAMARETGFDFAGVVPAAPSPRAAAFRAWLDDGAHAGMTWIARDPERRSDPRLVWPEARTLLVVGVSCHAGDPSPDVWNDPLRGRVARYAWGPDYHDVLGGRLHALAEAIRRACGATVAPREFVDTRPVLERDAAERAGLGFIGRSAMFIHPQFGPLVLLGGLALPWAVEPTAAAWPRGTDCGRCRRCLPACPAGALTAELRVDARRCASYLTIEHRGPIPGGLGRGVGRNVFGCDACQEVCPWMRARRRPAQAPFLRFDAALHAPRLEELVGLDEAGFRARYAGTPVARAKRQGLVRNAVIALGNSGHPDAGAMIEIALRDADPVVRAQAELASKAGKACAG